MIKKAVIVNCFDTYAKRASLVYDFWKAKGYDTLMLTSSFSHVYKRNIDIIDRNSDYIYLPTRPYYKNLSIQRMYSHFKLSQVILANLEEIKPDVLYVLCPPNSFAKIGGQYKSCYKHSTLIVDIIDLWPETLPIKCPKNIFPLNSWRNIRNNWLPIADYVIVECQLYKEFLQKYNSNIYTLYFAKQDTGIFISPKLNKEIISLCYVGSINSLIDIDMIVKIVSTLKQHKPVSLHVIGDGHARKRFLQMMSYVGADVIYYGKEFDEREKNNIFSKCNFGLNIMKESVCVGLTIKSIDYFEAGLPIINTIKGDTWNWVENERVGFNIDINNIEIKAKDIVVATNDDNISMRERCRKLYEENFSQTAFVGQMSMIYADMSCNYDA